MSAPNAAPSPVRERLATKKVSAPTMVSWAASSNCVKDAAATGEIAAASA